MVAKYNKKENKEDVSKELVKYLPAHYALNRRDRGEKERGDLIGIIHLARTRKEVSDLLEEIGLEGQPIEALKADRQHYFNLLSTFSLQDALEYFKAPTEMKDAFKDYKKSMEDIINSYTEYMKFNKAYNDALKIEDGEKAIEASVKALEGMKKREKDYRLFEQFMQLEIALAEETVAPLIAEYYRNKVAKLYKTEK